MDLSHRCYWAKYKCCARFKTKYIIKMKNKQLFNTYLQTMHMISWCCFEINGTVVCLYEEPNKSDKKLTNDGDAMFGARRRNLAAFHL
jgi:hypothetical protein